MTETESVARPELDTSGPLTGVAKRSVELTFAFNRAILNDPSILDDIPDGSFVVLIPADDPELAETEIEAGLAALRRGEDVYFRHVRPGDRAD